VRGEQPTAGVQEHPKYCCVGKEKEKETDESIQSTEGTPMVKRTRNKNKKQKKVSNSSNIVCYNFFLYQNEGVKKKYCYYDDRFIIIVVLQERTKYFPTLLHKLSQECHVLQQSRSTQIGIQIHHRHIPVMTVPHTTRSVPSYHLVLAHNAADTSLLNAIACL